MLNLKRVAGTEAGERKLNGPQTTGRTYRDLSEPQYDIDQTHMNVRIPVRDGVELLADIYLPKGARGPALLASSPYPRQIQNSGAPMGFVEAGATDFFVPRGYAHVILNERGTSGSGGTYDLWGAQTRRDLYDVIEWIAAQPWCDGNVGMVGLSAFAMAQIHAAVEQPPHLKAIFPLGLSADTYEAFWHGGLMSATFGLNWMRAVAIFSGLEDKFLRGKLVTALEHVLRSPRVHEAFGHHNGESALALFGLLRHNEPAGSWAELIETVSLLHPTKDEFWQERDAIPLVPHIRIPVYLGCDWENVPMHLGSTFKTLAALSPDVPVRVALLGRFGLTWPWESLHVEALAWYDQWLKGRDTGIMEGPMIRYVLPGEEPQPWREATAWPPPESVTTTFALRADGLLANDEGEAGTRAYTYRASAFAELMPKDASSLEWSTPPLEQAIRLAGPVEVVLHAASSAGDTGFVFALQDVAPDGTVVDVTAGWRRAAVAEGCAALDAVPAGTMRWYRVPFVDNARSFAPGHRIRLTLCGDDSTGPAPIMGFRHAPVGTSTRVTVASSSLLQLTTLPGA